MSGDDEHGTCHRKCWDDDCPKDRCGTPQTHECSITKDCAYACKPKKCEKKCWDDGCPKKECGTPSSHHCKIVGCEYHCAPKDKPGKCPKKCWDNDCPCKKNKHKCHIKEDSCNYVCGELKG